MRNLFLYGSLMIAMAAVPCNARTSSGSEGSLKLGMVSGRPVVEGIFLNGQGPLRFLLDTGAQTNQVDERIARKFGLAPTFRTAMGTAAGEVLVEGGRVAEVTLGPATAAKQEFLFTGLEGVHTLASNIQGVLGQEFLSHFDYLLDFAGHRLVIGGGAPDGGKRVGLNLVDGRPTVETDRGKLVLDSGTESAILFGSGGAGQGGRMVTASGSAAVSAVQRLKVRIAGREYVTSAASVARVSPQEDGLLPASLFHAVYVSNSEKYLVLDPAPEAKR